MPVLAALAMLAAAPSPPAADPFAGQIPDLVSPLVVQAVDAGPAWWKVTRGDSTVWILGLPPYGSRELAWDQKPLKRRLTGANAFILPVFLETQPWLDNAAAQGKKPITVGDRMTGSQSYDGMGAPTVADLPPEVRARLRAADDKVRVDRALDTSSLIYASRWLNIGMLGRADLSVLALRDQLNAAGAAAGVRRVTLPIDIRVISNAYIAGPAQPKLDCFLATLAQAESGPNPLGDAYRAWAAGDVPDALAELGCVGVKGALYRAQVDMLGPLLDAALHTPGRTVAAVELIPLLMKDGLIQRLQAAGYEVTAPDAMQGMNEED